MTFHLRLCTPDKTFFDAPADEIVCPGLNGYFGVLVHHLPLISGLGTGVLRVKAEGSTKFFVLDGGMSEVKGIEVNVFANAVFPSSTAAQAEEKLEELKSQRRTIMPFT
jgi:F-type H+-transporting ATPase subunit epsilon